MQTTEGNLWDFFGSRWVVVPTNIGWKKRADPDDPTAPCGPNPMGAGVAKELANRVPSAPFIWGFHCFFRRALANVLWSPKGWIGFPTKALDERNPEMSWKSAANLVLIERSAEQLAALRLPSREDLRYHGVSNGIDSEEVVLPLVGCGEGRLRVEEVIPILEKYLDDKFTLVLPQKASAAFPF